MFGWWRKKNAEAVSVGRPTASEVDSEYSEYLARIRRAMVFGALVAVLGTALFSLVTWMSGLSAAQSASESLRPTSPTVILVPLPASMTIAGFSLLAAIAIALQLAVRTPSEAEVRPATALARRRFLCGIARLVVLGSFTLAAYATIPVLVNLPDSLDIVRIFGPALCGTLVALIAADAGVASDPDFAPAEMGRVWRARVARRLLIGLRMIGDNAETVRARTIAWQVLVLVGVPVVIALTSFASAPELRPRQRVLLVVIALVAAAIVYAIAVRVYIAAMEHDWVGISFIIALTVILGTLCWLMLTAMMLQRASESQSTSLSPTMATGAWAITYVAVPAFLAAWFLTPSRDRRPRALGWIVRGVLVKRLSQRHKGLETAAKAAEFNRLALVAPWVSVFVPFGMILAVIAKQQIHRAKSSAAGAPRRGEWAANLAIGLTAFFFIVLIGGLFYVAALDPKDWNDFVWG